MKHLQQIPKPVDDKAAKALASVKEEVRIGWDKIADCNWQKKIKVADISKFSWAYWWHAKAVFSFVFSRLKDN